MAAAGMGETAAVEIIQVAALLMLLQPSYNNSNSQQLFFLAKTGHSLATGILVRVD